MIHLSGFTFDYNLIMYRHSNAVSRGYFLNECIEALHSSSFRVETRLKFGFTKDDASCCDKNCMSVVLTAAAVSVLSGFALLFCFQLNYYREESIWVDRSQKRLRLNWVQSGSETWFSRIISE